MKIFISIAITTSLLLLSNIVRADDFKIEFEWDPEMKKCSSNASPEIKLFDVPEGTTKLKVNMKDKQSNYRHGGGTVKYNGEDAIPAGALKNWEGPCPPRSETHIYVFTVKTKGGEKAKASYKQKYKQ